MRKILLLSLWLLPLSAIAQGIGDVANDVANTIQPEVVNAEQEIAPVVNGCEKQHPTDKQAQTDCVATNIQRLAENGNFVAAYLTGIFNANMGKKEEALAWFQKSLDNPKTPDSFKRTVQREMEKVKQATPN